MDEASQPLNLQQPESKPKKKVSGKNVAIIVLAILATGGIAFGIYELIQNKDTVKNTGSEAVAQIVQAPSEAVVETTPPKTDEKEIEITNGYVLRDLRHKIGLLHGVNSLSAENNDSISTSLAYNFIERVYTNTLNTSQKSAIAIKGELTPAINDVNYATGNYNEKILAFIKNRSDSNWWYNVNGQGEISYAGTLDYISYGVANKLYRQLFGPKDDMTKSDLKTNVCGEDYLYISSTDGFISAPSGCGGAGFPRINIKIDSYKAKGNEAYVDVRTATAWLSEDSIGLESASWKLYDGLYYKVEEIAGNHDTAGLSTDDSIENGRVLDTLADPLSTDEMIAKYGDQIKRYRFAFKLNSDGTYYFDRVEKL